jgi:hypothetical protein
VTTTELPEIISELIWQLRSAAYDQPRGAPNEEQALADRLRNEILAALEPERELRERAERLRMKVIDTYADIYASIEFEKAEGLHPGDLDDDLTT